MTAVDELLSFLRASLDEDERVAREATAAGASGSAEHWRAERVEYRHADTGVHDTWIVRGGRVKTPTLAMSPIDITPRITSHIARWDPARVLAEVEAKRRILELWTSSDASAEFPNWDGGHATALEDVITALAQPYAGQPGWREEWQLSDGA